MAGFDLSQPGDVNHFRAFAGSAARVEH